MPDERNGGFAAGAYRGGSTGGYQRAVVEALFHAGLSLAVVNSARVRHFARASGLLAKTDKLDAFVLAEFGKTMHPRRYEGKTEAEKQLSALLVRRNQLEEMLKAEQTRLRTTALSLKSFMEQVITCLTSLSETVNLEKSCVAGFPSILIWASNYWHFTCY